MRLKIGLFLASTFALHLGIFGCQSNELTGTRALERGVANMNTVDKNNTSRRIINFNRNWEFVKSASDDELVIPEKFRVPRDKFALVYASSFEDEGTTGVPEHAFDGRSNTFWHTEWKNNKPPYPHEIVIDLGESYLLEGFAFTPRADANHCLIKDFEIYVGETKTDWGEAVLRDSFGGKSERQLKSFASRKQGRYLRFVAVSGVNGNSPFAAIANLDFIKYGTTGSAWEDQYMIERVNKVQGDDDSVKPLSDELKSIAGRAWESVILPHTANIEERVGALPQWQGVCFYRKTFELPKTYEERQVLIEFEAAMQLADVWLNGEHVFTHAGGYTPFVIDLSDKLNYGGENVITVKLDNRDNPEIPPGKPVATLDFNYFSGIYRDVSLIVKNKLHITHPIHADVVAGGGVFVSYSDVSETQATVNVKTHIENSETEDAKVVVRQQLIDADGNVVCRHEGDSQMLSANGEVSVEQRVKVDNPKLWHPDSPNLYELKTGVVVDGILVDEVSTRIGIRWFEFSREKGFVINGSPLYLLGTNRHQSAPWIGNALSDNMSYRDIWIIKQAGFNIVRLGHYPQDASVYDACDELGLLVIDPMPGWQFFNSSEVFVNRTYRDIRDMIRRDRNHACVCLWEVILNESHPPKNWRHESHRIAHEEQPGPQCFTAGDLYGVVAYDILYNDWDEESFSRPQNTDRPAFVREYGDYEFGGGNSSTRRMRGVGEAELLGAVWNVVWSLNRYRPQYPWTFGVANWVMFDHNRGCGTDLSACGNSDSTRVPKFGYYFFQSQRDRDIYGPMVYLTNYWDAPSVDDKVVVFSNCDEVELVLNGKTVARQKPDDGPDSDFRLTRARENIFDGGNCRNLSRPPFTFNGIKWETGELRAVGYIAGEAVEEFVRRTPGVASRLEIVPEFNGRALRADGADAIFVHVHVKDENGTTILGDNKTEIALSVSGVARILSPEKLPLEAGMASFLIQSSGEVGEIKIFARALGLESAEYCVLSE